MWSHIGLCLLVGFACASTNPGWKENTEYVYTIRGRTFASLHEVAYQYSGILLKARLVIRYGTDGKFGAQISDPQYSQVHSQLPDGWNTHIPDSELNYQPLGLSGQPFQVIMKDGVIEDLIVDKKVSNWEANIIKSIMSQFQLNTTGIESVYGRRDTGNSAVFKSMEETVTGKTETWYDIHPLPEYILQSKPWMARYVHLKGDGEVIEVVKHKNYTNNMELPSYHYGLDGVRNWEPATNQMGTFFIRDSTSQAILTGNLHRYTIQNSYTVNEIIMSPTLNDKQKGSVVSLLNVTLDEIKSKGGKIDEIDNPVRLGGLVYTYDDPFSNSNGARSRTPSQRKNVEESESEEDESRDSSASYGYWHDNKGLYKYLGRSGSSSESSSSDSSSDSSSSDSSSSESSEEYYQDKPQMQVAPDSPLLPYTTGYQGMSIKQHKDINIVQIVQKIAQDIGNDLQNPETTLRQNTLNKFTIMTSLIRIMNTEELQQVARSLYNQAPQGPQREAWSAFRDGVAESGTGPAFLTIQDWIESQKVKRKEAAKIVSTATNSVRVPTVEYMKSFFEFIKKPVVQSQEYLNDTALIAYTNLVRKVYVDRKNAANEYPEKSFGRFHTGEGKKFVEESVIPYLTKRLSEAISDADTPKIHCYIRALGNVAHPNILAAFEPYLEGKKQVSQFQRLLMVGSMHKLARIYPKVARVVLYNIYQNSGEAQEVRVAAVYQLMRTSPPTDMLQRMAAYTNVDTQEHVNAAVKSSIESAADLEGDEYQYFRSSAQAAQPLLNNKNYGIQHGANFLYNYVMEELGVEYKETVQYLGNEEGYHPKGGKYSIRTNLGGFKHQLINVQAIVSSIDELIHVGNLQTDSYQEQSQKQKQHSKQQQQQPFSSLNIARLLNLKADEREQLEGVFYVEFADYIQKIISFDNHTIEELPEVIRKWEEELKNGKDYHYTTLSNSREMAISFPTEMGFPFLYTYDTPVLLKVEGSVKGAASPQFCRDGKLHKPDTVDIDVNMYVTVNSKVQSRLSFLTPFDYQQYISGYDKNFYVHVPLYGNTHVDIENQQVKAEIDVKEAHEGSRLFHYSTWPYTSKTEIKNFQPISLQHNTHHIYQKNARSYNTTFGKKETGIAFHVQINHERQSVSLPQLSQFLQDDGFFGGLLNWWDDASIQHSRIDVRYLPQQSSVRKYTIRFGYQQDYKPQAQGDGSTNPGYWRHLSQVSDPSVRQEDLINKIAAGIKSAEVEVYDASVEFQGDKNIMYAIIGGYGKSNVDPKSRVLIHYKKSSNSDEVKPYEITLQAKSFIPNTNGLDLKYSLEHEPKVDTHVQVNFGQTLDSGSQIQAAMEFRRSQGRIEFLKEEPVYQQCQREMRWGDYQLPACANMTMSSNLLDRVNIKVQYENMKPDVVDEIERMYHGLQFIYYPTLQVRRNKGTGKDNEINLQARFDPDLRSVNFSVQTRDDEASINNIGVEEWAKDLFVVHPVFHYRSRIMRNILGLQTYRPICVVDQTYASTFNNKTYPAPLSKHWTVVLQYVPKDARHQDGEISVEEQLRSQPENYVVLARQSSGKQGKDIKITFSSPNTSYQLMDVTMYPVQQGSSGPKAQVMVNDHEVKIDDTESHDVEDGYVQIYSLPNGEVKVEVRDTFYVIYDGQRMKLTVLDGKFRNSIRGLCGAFNDDETDDFLTSENCIARDYTKFVRGYEIESNEGKQQREIFAGNSRDCIPKEVPLYADVIPRREGGRGGSGGSGGKCTRFQTRYVEENGEICFTIRALPVCSRHCRQKGSITKNAPVHCLKKSNVAQLWKNQIDEGQSPNFSHKQQHRVVQMEVPQGCSE